MDLTTIILGTFMFFQKPENKNINLDIHKHLEKTKIQEYFPENVPPENIQFYTNKAFLYDKKLSEEVKNKKSIDEIFKNNNEKEINIYVSRANNTDDEQKLIESMPYLKKNGLETLYIPLDMSKQKLIDDYYSTKKHTPIEQLHLEIWNLGFNAKVIGAAKNNNIEIICYDLNPFFNNEISFGEKRAEKNAENLLELIKDKAKGNYLVILGTPKESQYNLFTQKYERTLINFFRNLGYITNILELQTHYSEYYL